MDIFWDLHNLRDSSALLEVCILFIFTPSTSSTFVSGKLFAEFVQILNKKFPKPDDVHIEETDVGQSINFQLL